MSGGDVGDVGFGHGFELVVLFLGDVACWQSLLTRMTHFRHETGQAREDGCVEDEGSAIRDVADHVQQHSEWPLVWTNDCHKPILSYPADNCQVKQ